jgi:hypothetical protein
MILLVKMGTRWTGKRSRIHKEIAGLVTQIKKKQDKHPAYPVKVKIRNCLAKTV